MYKVNFTYTIEVDDAKSEKDAEKKAMKMYKENPPAIDDMYTTIDPPRFVVEVTNTWRVEVDAENEEEAKEKALEMNNEGYDNAIDFDGAEILSVDED